MLLLFFGLFLHVVFALQYIPILQSVSNVTAQISNFTQSAARYCDDSPVDHAELPVWIILMSQQ